MARQQRGSTSLQGERVSYYSGPSQGRTVTTSSGYQLGQQGRTVSLQNPRGQIVSARVPEKTYHRIVLAEFIATIMIISAQGLFVPSKSGSKESGGGVSVSFAAPLVRLTSACIVFFVLALMASGRRSGKVAAAFGGLVLLGAALSTTEMWSALAKSFTGTPAGQQGKEG